MQRQLVGRGLDTQRLWQASKELMTCIRSSTARSLRALARESPEERETRRRANADTMREARARESREGETQRRANADAIREARARRIADRGWKTLPVHKMPHPHPLRLGGTHECRHCHAVLLKEEEPSFCCREGKIQLAPLPPLPRGWLGMYQRVAFKTASRRYNALFSFTAILVFQGRRTLYRKAHRVVWRKYCCSHPNVHTKSAEVSDATCTNTVPITCNLTSTHSYTPSCSTSRETDCCSREQSTSHTWVSCETLASTC